MSRYFELLRQANQGQDLFGEDVPTKASKASRYERAESESVKLRSSGGLKNSANFNRTLGAMPSERQPVTTAEPAMSHVGLGLQLPSGIEVENSSQEEKLPVRRRPSHRATTIFGELHGAQSGIPAEDTLNRVEEIKLVQRVFLLPGPEAPRRVVFSGVGPGNGSTWICARAGITLAGQVAGSVCVVDANLRSPSLHHHFGGSNDQGLSGALLSGGPLKDYVRQLEGSNLWVLTSGPLPSDPYGLLTSEGFRSRVVEMGQMFDYVLIDATPVNLSDEAALLGRLSDGVVLVIEANRTHREAARKAKERLEAVKSPILAAVLNNRTFPIPEGIYRRL